MSTPILATKLYIPPHRPNSIPRPRLMAQLNEGLHRKLTLVSAPAGFGKTTLVTEWLIRCGRPTAWLSLDERDNDLNNFLAYLVAAMQTIVPDFGTDIVAILQAPPPVPTEPVLTLLLNEIAKIPHDFFLILDDYHLIDAQPVDEVLIFLLDHLPPQMHLIMTTREDPDVPLARYRVRDQLTELRVTDLRFTPEEATEFLNQAMHLNLLAEEVLALDARTEGWIAGLQLAAMALQKQQDSTQFIQSFKGSHHFVLDYLVEEILNQQAEEVQTFLLCTSILDRMNRDLCAAVLGDTAVSIQPTLDYLIQTNLLVVPLDEHQEWFRYHHLFAEALQARLLKRQPEQIKALHQRACAWYETHKARPEAINHALAAQEFERAAALIELEWSIVRRSCFRSPTWLAWVQALPIEIVQMRPILNVGYAWELMNFGRIAEADIQMKVAGQWLDSADGSEEMIVVNEAEFPLLPASLANARAYYAQACGDVASTQKYANHTLTIAAESDYHTRGMAGIFLGMAAWASGDLDTAQHALFDGIENLRLSGNIHFALSATFLIAEIKRIQGRLHEAKRVLESGLQQGAAQKGLILQGTANLYLGLSELYREWGETETAVSYRQQSEALGETAALPDWAHRLCLLEAQIKEDAGELDEALVLINKAEQLYYYIPVPNVRPFSALKAQIWIKQNNVAEVQSWVREQNISVTDELTYLDEFKYITLARLLIAQFQNGRIDTTDDAEKLLQRLLNAADAGGRIESMLTIYLLQAIAQQAKGDKKSARVSLQTAVTLAEPEGYVRIFLKEGTPIAELLTTLKPKKKSQQLYVQKLIKGFQTQQSFQPASLNRHPLPEPLTPRERDVLVLMVDGRSNPEIAAELVIAVTTVKTHVKNIYEKLQVTNRVQAVARCQELNLL